MAKQRRQNNGENTVIMIAFIISVLTSIGLLVSVGIMFQSHETKEQEKISIDLVVSTQSQKKISVTFDS